MQVIDIESLSAASGGNWMKELAKEVLYDLGVEAISAWVDHASDHWGGTPNYENVDAMGNTWGGNNF